ncbi:MAG: Mrp/NBP35 family ATP-binding protein [Calditrichaeota bacterium]|nr:Mrp/NBP35 family ATP-binding protein [Calditrichota bacterium]
MVAAIRKEAPDITEVVEVLPDGSERANPTAPDDPWAGQARLEGVKLIVAVASGKGGVGKSTVAVNLALALSRMGLGVGLLDADIYGPSAPTMLGVHGVPPSPNQRIRPAEAFGLKVISIGFFIPSDAPMIWRGPMVMKAIDQFLHDVDWGTLDCLVVDLPPGTGDAQLTLAQQVPVDGAVIVTTPSDVALIDARRGLQMFRKVNIPVLGILENMSYFVCPHCGERTDVFSAGGGAETAATLGVDFLGEIPLDPVFRKTGDEGRPVVEAAPGSAQAKVFSDLAEGVWERITGLVPQWNLSACHHFTPRVGGKVQIALSLRSS